MIPSMASRVGTLESRTCGGKTPGGSWAPTCVFLAASHASVLHLTQLWDERSDSEERDLSAAGSGAAILEWLSPLGRPEEWLETPVLLLLHQWL